MFNQDTTLLPALDVILRKWRAEGVQMLPPVDAAHVIATLDGIGRKYSRDVVGLYCATSGMKDSEDDTRFWSLWPLDRLVMETLRYDRPYILFADFLIDSYFYCFRYENDNRSSVCIDYLNGEEPERLADSVNDFFEVYLSNAELLGMWK